MKDVMSRSVNVPSQMFKVPHGRLLYTLSEQCTPIILLAS